MKVKRVTSAYRDTLNVQTDDGSCYSHVYTARMTVKENLQKAIAEQRAFIADQQRRLAAFEQALAEHVED